MCCQSCFTTKIGPYLVPGAKLKKNKGTLFSQTLKVEENKVPLVFTNLASGPRYGHFLDSKSCVFLVTFFGFKAYTKHGRNSRNQA